MEPAIHPESGSLDLYTAIGYPETFVEPLLETVAADRDAGAILETYVNGTRFQVAAGQTLLAVGFG
jgi:hypothetical protein